MSFSIDVLSDGAVEDVDGVAAFAKSHISALGSLASTEAGAGALALTCTVNGVHRCNLDAEDLFDGNLDLSLVSVSGDEERVNVLLHEAVGLLRNDRCDDDVAWVGDSSH
ncbi:Hypothetical protein [Corynebacterium glutamicum ATCC 13032]|uniref:Uncharacterized protein n=2 Tax=Corynebacterium glutamicum TaxID=1718 RepID=Q8NT07_CORGL|nr:Hypothetical protein [Corynebacterium glutamicum ATCC 13032]BAF53578.1 hypothetical protein cgR_0609 [Corynebacterium glutamicum R]